MMSLLRETRAPGNTLRKIWEKAQREYISSGNKVGYQVGGSLLNCFFLWLAWLAFYGFLALSLLSSFGYGSG